jgi:hypothetical protein
VAVHILNESAELWGNGAPIPKKASSSGEGCISQYLEENELNMLATTYFV